MPIPAPACKPSLTRESTVSKLSESYFVIAWLHFPLSPTLCCILTPSLPLSSLFSSFLPRFIFLIPPSLPLSLSPPPPHFLYISPSLYIFALSLPFLYLSPSLKFFALCHFLPFSLAYFLLSLSLSYFLAFSLPRFIFYTLSHTPFFPSLLPLSYVLPPSLSLSKQHLVTFDKVFSSSFPPLSLYKQVTLRQTKLKISISFLQNRSTRRFFLFCKDVRRPGRIQSGTAKSS